MINVKEGEVKIDGTRHEDPFMSELWTLSLRQWGTIKGFRQEGGK